MDFQISNQYCNTRTGTVNTAHGTISTPAFMPVGTSASVKAMTNDDIVSTNTEIILCNTYHLMLRPSHSLIQNMGGLHKFMNWQLPILTDSGGFQVMSLEGLRKITEEGVAFSSHIDGTKYMLTPEKSIDIQYALGSDISMVLDECTPYPADYETAKQSMLMSMRWAKRSKSAFISRRGYGVFGIVQGGIYEDLRKESVSQLLDIGFNGYAIGGLAVGEGQERMFNVLDYTVPHLPDNAPRYLMGVGKPDDILGAIARGIDMMDCVLPSRSGRNGQAFTRLGAINIRNAQYKYDDSPLDDQCHCYSCKNHSKAYLNHLAKSKEILASMLITRHNIHFYQNLMHDIRKAINENNFNQFHQDFLSSYRSN